MKISELSRRSGVPLPTIKFYIREGLLAAGVRTAKTQAVYNEEHIERLSLIRALKDDAGLSLGTITNMLRASDASPTDFIEVAIDAIERPVGPPIDESSEEFQSALKAMLEIAAEMGCPGATGAARDGARALFRIRRAFGVDPAPVIRLYSDVARQIAQIEIPDDWSPQQKRMSTLRYAVLGTVMFEPVILALRRMAHVARAHMLEEKHRRATGAAPQAAPPSVSAPRAKPARSSDRKPAKGKRRR
jgi:DNA-binding transcriptional MerR regulator